MAEPTDRVQVLKQESAAGGGDNADRDPFNTWETIDEDEDALSAAGVFLQAVGGTPDEAVLIWREGNDLMLKDPANPAGKSLTTLSSGGVNIGADTDFLLQNDPPEPNTAYAVTRSGGLVTFETWTRSGGNKIKDIEYTRSGGVVTQEDIKVYATDGTTVLGHLRIVYTRTGGVVTSAAYTRVV